MKTDSGSASYNINYAGKNKLLSAEQLTAALFTKLKDIAETALSVKVNDVVISVPSYFTDAERRALLDSAKYDKKCIQFIQYFLFLFTGWLG